MTRKLKIAQVAPMIESVPPRDKNGLEFVVSWITEELVKRGHEVTLFAPSDSQTTANLFPILDKGSAYTSRDDWERHFFSVWNTIIAGSAKEQFDVIHCHNRNSALISPFTDSTIVETFHHSFEDDNILKDLHRNTTSSKNTKVIGDFFKKINYVTVSKHQENQFIVYEESSFKNHTTIYNGIPVEKFDFSDKPGDYLLFLGYINKNKGADTAVRVAQKLGMKLILAGNNIGEEKFFEEHIKPHLNDKIQYVGPVNFVEKNKLYKNALAKLDPLAWNEPFGLTIVESQACGTPVIAFEKGAAPELIKEGETGFVVKSEEEMVEAVKKVSQLKRTACRAWVEQNFSVEKMVDGYEALYKKLTEQQKPQNKSFFKKLGF